MLKVNLTERGPGTKNGSGIERVLGADFLVHLTECGSSSKSIERSTSTGVGLGHEIF